MTVEGKPGTPFWTRAMIEWAGVFLLVHGLCLGIMHGTDEHWWAWHETRDTPAWIRFSEVPFYLVEPGFAVAYVAGSKQDTAEASPRNAGVVVLTDVVVWLLPVVLIRWSDRRRWVG